MFRFLPGSDPTLVRYLVLDSIQLMGQLMGNHVEILLSFSSPLIAKFQSAIVGHYFNPSPFTLVCSALRCAACAVNSMLFPRCGCPLFCPNAAAASPPRRGPLCLCLLAISQLHHTRAVFSFKILNLPSSESIRHFTRRQRIWLLVRRSPLITLALLTASTHRRAVVEDKSSLDKVAGNLRQVLAARS